MTVQYWQARAEKAEAEVALLRGALEDVLLFEHPPGGSEPWKRAWAAIRSTSAKTTA